MMGIRKTTIAGIKHKKGDIVKTKIAGVETNCIIISDFIEDFDMISGDNYLGGRLPTGYIIYSWTGAGVPMFDSFLVLIGDQKVYVHYDEIW